MTHPALATMVEAAKKATQGEWTLWIEPTPTKYDAIGEMVVQIDAVPDQDFAGAVYLLNAGGKCPATTGCGPRSAENAAHILATQPANILSLDEYVRGLEEALVNCRACGLPPEIYEAVQAALGGKP